MKERIALLALLALVGSVNAYGIGTIIILEMQELEWEFTDPATGLHEGTATVVIPQNLVVHSVERLYVQFKGIAVLEAPENPEIDEWYFAIHSYLFDPASGSTLSGRTTAGESGPYNVSSHLGGPSGPFPEFLIGSRYEVVLEGAGGILSLTGEEAPSFLTATIESAYLWVEGDYVLPTEEYSWGAVKSLFR